MRSGTLKSVLVGEERVHRNGDDRVCDANHSASPCRIRRDQARVSGYRPPVRRMQR